RSRRCVSRLVNAADGNRNHRGRPAMNNNVLVLPVQRKRGRRRVRPVNDALPAAILNFEPLGASVKTPEEKLAEIDLALTRVATAMLTAIRAVKEIDALVKSR